MSEPTLGEVLRRLDDAVTQIASVAMKLDAQQEKNDALYLRKETYSAQREADRGVVREVARDVHDMREERKADQQWKRSASLTVALAVLAAVVSIVLGIANLVAR